MEEHSTTMDFSQLIRLNMRIIGTVQRVGYRHIVQNIARKHNITGTIENLEGYDVRIVAEGTRKDLEAFKQAIKISEYPILVECIESSEEPYLGCFSYFQVIRGSPEEELAERFDSAIAIFSRMERKQDQALEMHKESIGLQQETLGLEGNNFITEGDIRTSKGNIRTSEGNNFITNRDCFSPERNP